MGLIVYNGVSTDDYDIQVEYFPDYEIPEREYEAVHVPGRNGDILIDKGSYKNVARSYNIGFGSYSESYASQCRKFLKWLYTSNGYARLEDSYDPEVYRMAAYGGASSIQNIYDQAGRITIQFSCKPQKFLKIGDIPVTFTGNGTLHNPTDQPSLPLLILHGNGSGSLTVAGKTISITGMQSSSAVTIDCEIQDAYSGSENYNNRVSTPNGFPVLFPGDNLLSFTGGITSVEVIPKWWTL